MYNSLEEICREAEKNGKEFWQVIRDRECEERGIRPDQSFAEMLRLYEAMRDSDRNYDGSLMADSGLVGGLGKKLGDRRREGRLLAGSFVGAVMERALKISESNACMRRIVACPTAGSCGVVPAAFLTMQENGGYSDEEMVRALYVAAGIGGVIAGRASLSGAAGGCQAEIGSASAMAAGGLVFLMGGTPRQSAHGAALALKSLLGLVCDPVAGLVQIPCVKRNVIGAVNAVTSADMAMAEIESVIPPDEVIDAMRTVGAAMSADLRETGVGGLAGTPTGVMLKERLTASGPQGSL